MKNTKKTLNGIIFSLSMILVIVGLVFLGAVTAGATDGAENTDVIPLLDVNYTNYPRTDTSFLGVTNEEIQLLYPDTVDVIHDGNTVKVADIGAGAVTYNGYGSYISLTLEDGYWVGTVEGEDTGIEFVYFYSSAEVNESRWSVAFVNGSRDEYVNYHLKLGKNGETFEVSFGRRYTTVIYVRDDCTYQDRYYDGVLESHTVSYTSDNSYCEVVYSPEGDVVICSVYLFDNPTWFFYLDAKGWSGSQSFDTLVAAPEGYGEWDEEHFTSTCPSVFPCDGGCTFHENADCESGFECTVCGAIDKLPAEHEWIEATCISKRECSLCGKQMGINSENHEGVFENGFYTCCGKFFEPKLTVGVYEIDGDTSTADEVYEISNAGELFWFSNAVNASGAYGLNAVLVNDIVLNEGDVKGSDGVLADGWKKWTAIGKSNSYTGYFDGQGHSVSGLYTDDIQGYYVGLFGRADGAHICNVSVVNSYFKGTNHAGSIVAYAYNMEVVGCYSDSTVRTGSVAPAYAGGIVGYASWICIQDCMFEGTVSGTRIGGLAGVTTGSTFKNSLLLNPELTLYCEQYSGAPTIINVFALESDTVDYRSEVTVVNTEALASGEVAYLLGTAWGQTLDGDAPETAPVVGGKPVYRAYDPCSEGAVFYTNTTGATNHDGELVNGIYTCCGLIDSELMVDGVYNISTAEQLRGLILRANEYGGSYQIKLTADIDISEYGNIMFGTEQRIFEGSLDGQGHSLTVKYDTSEQYAALFRFARNLRIENLTLNGSITTSEKFAASFVGLHANGGDGIVIDNCVSNVRIVSSVNGDGTHGGFVANNASAKLFIYNSAFHGSMEGVNTHSCGGLVGWSEREVLVDSTLITATFTVSSNKSATVGRCDGNNYTLNKVFVLNQLGDFPTGAEMVSEDALSSGEVAYLLGGVWGQELGTDKYPVVGGKKVYFGYICDDDKLDKVYTNRSSANPDGKPEHAGTRATCVDPSVCTECGKTLSAPLGHDIVTDAAVAPTCTDTGLTEGEHCSRCDGSTVAQDVVPALGHTWQNATVEAPKTCSVCGETEGEPLPEPKGLSVGGIVGISLGSLAVLGVGGFSLVWFVIKKKTFADLLLIFKR